MSIPVFAPGRSLTSSGTSVYDRIPADSAGRLPLFVRVTATASGYFRISNDGSSAAIGDTLIQPSDGLILKTCGLSYFSFVSASGSATVTVTPIDVGGIAYPASVFTPLSLFAAGEQGAWYDPSDFSTLFQDAAGTTPVTAVDQPVGLMRDKSGRGNHAFQSTSANRPVLKVDANGCYYLLANGTNTAMQTNSIDFTGTDKMTAVAGVRKLSDTARGIVFEAPGGFNVNAPASNSPTYSVYNSGSAGVGPVVSAASYPAPESVVLSFIGDIAAPKTMLRRNSSTVVDELGSLGTGNYGNYPLYLFARSGTSLFFNGQFYGAIIRGAQSSAAEIANAEQYLNGKTKAY